MRNKDHVNPWLLDGSPFDDRLAKKYAGFVYLITNLIDGRKYLGRKYFHSIRKVKGKSRRQRFESNWVDYWGSSDEVKDEIKKHGVDNFRREILSLHKTEGDCNFEEVRQQFLHNVLEDDLYYNTNINGKWYAKPDHIIEGRYYANNNLLKA